MERGYGMVEFVKELKEKNRLKTLAELRNAIPKHVGFNELQRRTKISRSQLWKHLNELESEQKVGQDEESKYFITEEGLKEFVKLAKIYSSTDTVAKPADFVFGGKMPYLGMTSGTMCVMRFGEATQEEIERMNNPIQFTQDSINISLPKSLVRKSKEGLIVFAWKKEK